MSKIERNISAGWVKPIDCSNYDESAIKIISFYLFKTPCENTSSMSIPLSSYGWDKKSYSKLFCALLQRASLTKGETYQKAEKLDEMSSANNAVGFNRHFNQKRDINRLVLFHDKKKPLILDLLFYIRCSFAHGRFAIYNDSNTPMYAFEAIKNDSSRFMAVLSEETLLSWIDIITGGPSRLSELDQEDSKNNKIKIFELIEKTTYRVTKAYISSTLHIKEKDLEIAIKQMKTQDMIAYNNSKRSWEIIKAK